MQPSFVLTDRSNQDLLSGAKHLVGRARNITAHLIAHLAEIHSRDLHVSEGFPTLADYCRGALGLSEDEAYRRAHAAMLAKQFPVILDLLFEGSIHLTTLRIIGRCLTKENHNRVLDAARGKNRSELEHLAAALCPRPDVPTILRKVPAPRCEPEGVSAGESLLSVEGQAVLPDEARVVAVAALPTRRSAITPLSPERYNLQLTVSAEAYHALAELQELLRHQVPNGDLATIVEDSLLERRDRVKRERFGFPKRSRKQIQQSTWIEGVDIEGDKEAREAEVRKAERHQTGREGEAAEREPAKSNSRHIPREVKRTVWERDKGRCTFVSHGGRRCSSRAWIEFHHIEAYALGGPATVDNIALRCRAHNAYEGAVLFRGGKKCIRPGANGSSGAKTSGLGSGLADDVVTQKHSESNEQIPHPSPMIRLK